MTSFADLLNSIVLLLALGVIYDTFGIHHIRSKFWRDTATGILIGFIGLAIMLSPWQFKPGMYFDARGVLLSLCALYFGRSPVLIAMLMTAGLRLYQGGDGALVGCLIIISSGLIGLFWRAWFPKLSLSWLNLLVFGYTIQISGLLIILLLPNRLGFEAFNTVAPVVLTLFPLGTLLLGLLLRRQQAQRNYAKELNENKKILARERSILKCLLDSIPDLIFYKSASGHYMGCNTAFEKFSATSENDLVSKTDYDLFEPQIAAGFRQQDLKMLATKSTKTNEEWVTYPDGKNVLLDTLKTPFYDQDGIINGLIGVSRDITERHQATEKLRESDARFRQIFESMPKISVQGYDKNRKVIFWNSASEALYGYSEKQALGKTIEQLIIPTDLIQSTITEFNASFANLSTQPACESIHQDIDAKLISVFSTRVIIKGLSNETEIYCIDIDLSAQKQAEQQAIILSQALEQSPMSVVITDPSGIIEYVNQNFEQTSGYQSSEVIGQLANVLKSDTTPLSLYKELWQKISNGQAWQGELQNKKKDGSLFWEQAYIAPVIDNHNNTSRYLAVKHDITAQKEQEQRILYQAHFDNLTGLPNRFLSLDRLGYMLSDAKRLSQTVAVLFLDFDDFKKVNDTLGHHEGDQLLVEAARRLKSVVRDSDVVGRLGGDEFIVLIPHHNDPNSVAIVAEKLLKKFRQPFQLGSRKLVSTISIGIATYPDDGCCSEELLKQADAAMYSSKANGRNTYTFYTEKMNQDLARRVLIEEQLRLAITNNELFVCYQPLINLTSKKVDGAEALLRWNNPVLGNVRPDEFIPIAEQTGLIIEIGQFVMAKAIEQTAQWRCQFNCNLYISINVSPLQFREASLIEKTLKLLDQFQLPPSAIEFEITEGLLVSGNESVEQALHQLSECGIGLAMDDFGTGYSSLNYLRNYPFDTLKIDKSFIDNIATLPADLKLVSAAISMGHALNLRVIAEGVEHQEQQKLLEQLGCDVGQGYLFGKPIIADEFERQHFARSSPLN